MLRFTELLTLAYRTRVKSLLKGTFLYIVLLWDLPLYGEKIIKGLGKIAAHIGRLSARRHG